MSSVIRRSGKKFKIDEYCGVIENFFRNKFNKNIHELSFYYTLTPLEKLDTTNFTLMENDKGNIIKLDFKWGDIEKLKNMILDLIF